MDAIYRYLAEGMKLTHKISESIKLYDSAAHEHWELIFMKKGDMTYTVNGKEYHPGRNSLIITRPMDYHFILIGDTEPYDRYVFHFEQNLISEDICKQLPQDLDVVSCDGNDLICGLFPKFDYYIERFEGEILRRLLLNLVEEILCNAILAARKADAENAYTANPIVTQAVQYINENITRPLVLEEIAGKLCIAKSHLHRLFIKYMKVSPKKFVISQKLILARRDLCAGHKAAEVCAKYGFLDYSSFYRNYTQYFGHKPSEAENYRSALDTED